MTIQIVIFGASGDLTRRKLVPALLRNARAGALRHPIQVVGVSRSDKTHDEWYDTLSETLSDSLKATLEPLKDHFRYLAADALGDLSDLAESLDQLDPQPRGRLYYLALAPSLFGPVVERLHAAGLLHDAGGFRRVVVEKPFGRDLESARALNGELRSYLREDQIFRIDHYLGKETVQNLLSFRFQNAIFEPLWNRKHVESVEISVSEQVVMEGRRGAYYDTAGALRDMVQNHLLQVFSLVAMEPPGSLDPDAIRSEKVKALQALRPFDATTVAADVVRAQYRASESHPRSYRDEHGVASDSMTETFVAIRAHVDNWRWSGVPFLMRTGKGLDKRFTEVVLRFRTPPINLLNGPTPANVCQLRPNALRLLIQPEEGMRLGFLVKQPGPGMTMRSAELGFDYAQLDAGESPPAYQRLLLDALEGNPTLFIREDEVEACWRFADAIRSGWEGAEAPMHTYPVGSRGPEPADELFRDCEGIWSPGP